MPPVYDAVQAVTPGMYERSPVWWEHRLLADPPDFRFGGGPKIYAVLEVDGAAQAYALYRLHVSFGSLGPESKLNVIEAIGATPAATASIWRFLLDVDWMQTIVARLLPVDHPLLLLLARPNYATPTLSDALWVRLVDVGAALSGRSFAGDGSIVLDVRDSFCPWNEGRWKLEGGEAARTTDEAEVALDVGDLGSVYLGGFTFRALVRAGRVEELRHGAIARADALFRTDAAPWCPEIF
jgi:predicted acetyltransferase